MADPILLLSLTMAVVVCAWALQRLMATPDEASEGQPAVPSPTSKPTPKPQEPKKPAVPQERFEMVELPELLIHRQPNKVVSSAPLNVVGASAVEEPHFSESVIKREEMRIPSQPFSRYSQEGQHLFFAGDKRTLVEVWQIGESIPRYPWLESLRASITRYDELFAGINRSHDSLIISLEIVEAYLMSPIVVFKEIAKARIEEYLATRDLDESARELVEGGCDFGLVGHFLGDHLLYWVINGHWHEPIRVGILRSRRHEWVAAGLWGQVLHLLGRLILLAPEARKLHGRAAGTWSQLRGALREIVNAHLEGRENEYPGTQLVPIAELEEILSDRERWPAWSMAAGRRNLWRVLSPLAAVEESSSKLGHILAKMQQESRQYKQLSFDL